MVKVMRSRRMEWFGHIKRRHETGIIRAVTIIKDRRDEPQRKTQVEMENHCQEGPESIAHQSRIIH